MHKVAVFVTVLFIDSKNRVLLLKRRPNANYYPGRFVLPGGKLDEGEQIIESAKREGFEEVGLNFDDKTSKIVNVCYFKRWDGLAGIDFYVLATSWLGVPENLEPDKHELLDWFPVSQLPKEISDNHRFAINQYLKGHFFSQMGWSS